MPLEQTAKIYVMIDGEQVGRVQSIDAMNESGAIEVLDIENGLAAFGVGAGKTTLKWTMYVPSGGMVDFNFWNEGGQFGGIHEVQMTLGAESYISEGRFRNCQIVAEVETETKCTVEFTGQPKDLE